jgi:hypothetical protein
MLCPGGIYSSYGRDACINFREGSFDWKLKVLVHFSRVKSNCRAGNLLPHVLFFPHASDKNFDTAILSKIAQRLDNKKSSVNITPQDPWAGIVSYTMGANMVLIKGMCV